MHSPVGDSPLLDAATMLRAYSIGLFPMAESRTDSTLCWVQPRERGIIPLDDRFHLPRSLAKALRRADYRLRYDCDFATIVTACAEARPESWINPTLEKLYNALYQQGYGHSVEVYDLDNRLIGGLFGIALGGVFFGESMFSRRTNASKIALVSLVNHLRDSGFGLLDCQFYTDHLGRFGAFKIDHADYLTRLQSALTLAARW